MERFTQEQRKSHGMAKAATDDRNELSGRLVSFQMAERLGFDVHLFGVRKRRLIGQPRTVVHFDMLNRPEQPFHFWRYEGRYEEVSGKVRHLGRISAEGVRLEIEHMQQQLGDMIETIELPGLETAPPQTD